MAYAAGDDLVTVYDAQVVIAADIDAGSSDITTTAAVSSGVRGLREPLYALTATFSSKVCAVELALSNTLASESKKQKTCCRAS